MTKQKTRRETLKSYEISNVNGGRKATSLYTDEAKQTGRETLESYDYLMLMVERKQHLHIQMKQKQEEKH